MLSSLPIMSSAEVEPPPSPSKRAVKRKRKAHQQQSSDSSGSTQHEDDVATLAPPPTTAPTTIRIKTPQRRRLPSILFWINLALANSSTILVALSAVALWLFVSYLRGSLHALVASLLSTPFHLFAYRPSISNQWERLSGSLAPVLAFSCSTVGLGCSSVDRESAVGGAARTARVQAAQALDLFDSVLSLGRSDGGLHHVAIWELSVAVQHTSAFQNREFLSGQLQELGDMTRDVKDEVIRLNSQGLNSFTWIVHEFTRLENVIDSAATRPSSTNRAALDSLLTSLYEKISTDLSALLTALDRAIRVADRASSLGGRLVGALSEEEFGLRREKEDASVWKNLIERQGWKGKQLKRDLALAGESVGAVKDLRWNLEKARGSFLEYESNVGHFKSGLIGYHLAGHGLSAEEEVASLRHVLDDFRRTLHEAKGGRAVPPSSRTGIDPAPKRGVAPG